MVGMEAKRGQLLLHIITLAFFFGSAVAGAEPSPKKRTFLVVIDAGHGGKSGRFRRYREQAEMFAFLLDQLAVVPVSK